MRLADKHDLLRCTGADEFMHDLAAIEFGIFDLAVQFAVGEQAGTAFTKLYVGFRRQHFIAPQRPGVLGAGAHIPAALQYDRLEAHLRQCQRGKQTAGAKTDDYRSFCQDVRRFGNRVIAGIGGGANVTVIGKAFEHRGFVIQRDVDDVNEGDFAVLLARIVAALEHREI